MWLLSGTHLRIVGMAGYTESGLIGRPSLATKEKGQLVLADLVAKFKRHLTQLAR
jgi:creatinine amidohydrolase